MSADYRPEWADPACQTCRGTGFVRGHYGNLPAAWDEPDAEPCETCQA